MQSVFSNKDLVVIIINFLEEHEHDIIQFTHAVPSVYRIISRNINSKRLLLAYYREYKLSKLYRKWRIVHNQYNGEYIRKLTQNELEFFTTGKSSKPIAKKLQSILIAHKLQCILYNNRDKCIRVDSICRLCHNLVDSKDQSYHLEYCQQLYYATKVRTEIHKLLSLPYIMVCTSCCQKHDLVLKYNELSTKVGLSFINNWNSNRKCYCLCFILSFSPDG